MSCIPRSNASAHRNAPEAASINCTVTRTRDSRSADAAAQHYSDLQLLADLVQIFFTAAEFRRRIPGHYPQPFHPRQVQNQLFGKSIAEIVLIFSERRTRREICKRQHRNGGLHRGRGRENDTLRTELFK